MRDDSSYQRETIFEAEEALRKLPAPASDGAREALENSQSLLVMLYSIDGDTATWKHEGVEALLKEQIIQNRSVLSAVQSPATGDKG